MLDARDTSVGVVIKNFLKRIGLVDSCRTGLIAKIGPFRCPVCRSRTWKYERVPPVYNQMWSQYGAPDRENQLETWNVKSYFCPTCQSSDRNRLYAMYLAKYLRQLTPCIKMTFVEFAPSKPLGQFIRSEIYRLGLDMTHVTADLNLEWVQVKVNLEQMTVFSDQSVDFFLCSHVLEHVRNDQRALSELFRILKLGGKGILMVPINLGANQISEDPSVHEVGERWGRFGQNDHVREYSRMGFIERVRSCGFVLHEYGVKDFGYMSFWRNGITNKSVLYVVEKAISHDDTH